MRRLVEARAATTAAVIVEPLVQGSAGMRVYPAEYLRQLRGLCDRHNVLLIADEIAVGFGRTGRMFACDHAGVTPDLLCLGKGLTAGALPLSAVLATERVYDAFRDTPAQDRTFYHGHTFCGNPIAAAAAVATLDVFAEEDVIARSESLRLDLAAAFGRFGGMASVDRWSAFGAIGVVRLRGGLPAARAAARHAMGQGLLIRPLGDVLYLCPPLTTSALDVRAMLGRFEDALGSVEALAAAQPPPGAAAVAE
jgi:adenosylmethionine-8-amino-7-oxononanoate aminotransferase